MGSLLILLHEGNWTYSENSKQTSVWNLMRKTHLTFKNCISIIKRLALGHSQVPFKPFPPLSCFFPLLPPIRFFLFKRWNIDCVQSVFLIKFSTTFLYKDTCVYLFWPSFPYYVFSTPRILNSTYWYFLGHCIWALHESITLSHLELTFLHHTLTICGTW